MFRALLFSFAAALPAAAAPRALSTDFCADQFLLALADPEQIAALSPDADNDFSYLRARAARHRRLRPDAEAVLALEPDIVLRFWGGDAPRMEKLGLEVIALDYASDFDGVKENIRRASKALQQEARGAALIAEIDARLAELTQPETARPRALYLTPGGVTAGAGTMIDEILKAAGAVNIAAEGGAHYWQALPMERVITAPPELIVTGFFSADSERVNHWSAARHPAYRKVFTETRTVHLSADLLSCPAWFSLDAAEAVAAAIGGRDD